MLMGMIMLYKLKYGNYCLTLQTNIPYMMCYCVYNPERYVYNMVNHGKPDTEELKNNFPMNLDNFNGCLNDIHMHFKIFLLLVYDEKSFFVIGQIT